MKAYMMLKVYPAKEDDVIKEIQEIPSVEEVHKVFGEYDVIVEVIGHTFEQIVDITSNKIRSIEGIKETSTQLVVDSEIDYSATTIGH